MSNGADKVLDKVGRILEQGNKMSTRVGLELSLELAAENHRLLTQLLKEVKEVKSRSWGNWAYEHPKRFFTFAVIFILVFISDFRHPIIVWAQDNISYLISLIF